MLSRSHLRCGRAAARLVLAVVGLLAGSLDAHAAWDLQAYSNVEARCFSPQIRRVYIYSPVDAAGNAVNTAGMPVVFALHGGGQNASYMYSTRRGIKATAQSQGFVTVFPDGRGSNPANLHWVDEDVRYVDCLIDWATSQFSLDPTRRYVVGFSAGANLAYQLAADSVTGPKIAAIGTAAGVVGKKHLQVAEPYWDIVDLNPTALLPYTPPSAILLQGGLDRKHPVAGGYTPESGDVNFSFRMSVDLYRIFAGTTTTRRLLSLFLRPDAEAYVHSTGQPTEPDHVFQTPTVASILAPDTGHEWPSTFNYMRVVWEFFMRVPTR